MARSPGDRVHGHGDEITVYNDTGSEIGEGYFVEVSGEYDGDHEGDFPKVVKSDSDANNGRLVGVTADPIGSKKYGTVRLRGAVEARVESSVSAGSELASPDTSATSGANTAGVAGSGGSTGIYTVSSSEAVDEGDGEMAEVLLR